MKKHTVSYCDERAQYWLSYANVLIEKGASKSQIDEAERKAQYWLDRLNIVEGYS